MTDSITNDYDNSMKELSSLLDKLKVLSDKVKQSKAKKITINDVEKVNQEINSASNAEQNSNNNDIIENKFDKYIKYITCKLYSNSVHYTINTQSYFLYYNEKMKSLPLPDKFA